jgi:hypothetical protein
MQRHLRVEQGYRPPAYSPAQLAEFADDQLRLLAPIARNYLAAEEREVQKLACCAVHLIVSCWSVAGCVTPWQHIQICTLPPHHTRCTAHPRYQTVSACEHLFGLLR